MAFYTLHDLGLEVHQEVTDTAAGLDQLLQDLSCVRTQAVGRAPDLRLTVRRQGPAPGVPPRARQVFQAEGFWGLEHDDAFYLTDGTSLLHLQAQQGHGEAHLSSAFWRTPLLRQRTFWAFGLLKLLRPRGYYSLHAAGLVSPAGQGVLLIGSSGSGKSTLTVGVVRQGWQYLSDDAVLLRLDPAGVAALAFRKPCYVDARAVTASTALPLGEEVPDRWGRPRRLLRLADAYPAQAIASCRPQGLLFARIVPEAHSTIRPLDGPSALKHLLAQSGPQLFDRRSMAQHLDLLKRLVQQTTSCELLAGKDLYQQPARLGPLLDEAGEGNRCPAG